MSKGPKKDRTVRREAERRAARAAEDRERLLLREPGGSAERAIDVESAGVVEIRARSVACPRCGAEHAVEHVAVTVGGDRLREARLRCRRCGSRRSMWFRLPVLN